MCREWLKWCRRAKDQRVRVVKAWTDIRNEPAEMPPSERWHAVSGPMSAVIATLLDPGWSPVRPRERQDAESSTWKASDRGRNDDPFFKKLAMDIHLHLRGKSTMHCHEGAEKGMELWSLKNLFDKWNRKGRMIAAGGVWTKVKLSQQSQDLTQQQSELPDIMCERCHIETDDDLHRFWTCPNILNA